MRCRWGCDMSRLSQMFTWAERRDLLSCILPTEQFRYLVPVHLGYFIRVSSISLYTTILVQRLL